MREEVHIAGLVVHAAPGRRDSVAAAIAAMAGARVHAACASGKLVVTLEAATAGEMLAGLTGIQRSAGVLSAGLVYECVDTVEAMNEVMDDEDTQGFH